MIENCKLIYRTFMVRITLWLAHRLGLGVLPPGWLMFDPAFAEAHGINQAVIHAKITAWNRHNARRGINRHDGLYWSWNTAAKWQADFRWLSAGYIAQLLRSMESAGLILSGRFGGVNQAKFYHALDVNQGVKKIYKRGVEILHPPIRNSTPTIGKTSNTDSTIDQPQTAAESYDNVAPAPAAADPIPDSGEFVSEIIQEGQTHGDERNESVDIPGYDDVPAWAQEFQAWNGITQRQTTPPPVPRPPSPNELARVRKFLPTMSRVAVDALLKRHGIQAVLDLITEAETGAAAGRVRNPQGVVIAGLRNMGREAA